MAGKILRIYDHRHGQVYLYADGEVICTCGKICAEHKIVFDAFENGDLDKINEGKGLQQMPKPPKKNIIKTFQFRSSRDASISYSTLLYEDGTVSCNCPGWTRHIGAEGTRGCKHTAEIYAYSIANVMRNPVDFPVVHRPSKNLNKHGQPAKAVVTVARRFKFDD